MMKEKKKYNYKTKKKYLEICAPSICTGVLTRGKKWRGLFAGRRTAGAVRGPKMRTRTRAGGRRARAHAVPPGARGVWRIPARATRPRRTRAPGWSRRLARPGGSRWGRGWRGSGLRSWAPPGVRAPPRGTQPPVKDYPWPRETLSWNSAWAPAETWSLQETGREREELKIQTKFTPHAEEPREEDEQEEEEVVGGILQKCGIVESSTASMDVTGLLCCCCCCVCFFYRRFFSPDRCRRCGFSSAV